MRKSALTLAIAIPLFVLLAAFAYNLPPVHSRLAWRLDDLRTRVKYALNPPEAAIFVPQGNALPPPAVHTLVFSPTPPPTAAPTSTPVGPTATPSPTPLPTLTPTPLPDKTVLSGVKYEDQHGRWNYCGPANLSMALTFWGWQGNRDVVGKYVKPNDKDKNVMPYEMQDFVQTQTQGMDALIRTGGDIDLIKRMIAGGFPVLVEKGYYELDYTGKLGWMGHYQFVNGYDDAKGVLILQDTYVKDGKDHQTPYAEFMEGWRSFDYIFLIVYPVDRLSDVLALLGPYGDATWANQHALETAQADAQSLTGIDQFFAWFDAGTSLVNLQQYAEAAAAFDTAFSLYANLPQDNTTRPYRMLWYQTSPYWAYFYSGRYQDVVDLADTTLNDTISEPVLEESFYWRGLAEEALGDLSGAVDDLRQSVKLNPNFGPGRDQLARLGVEP
jgi:tetratricopeptide (TPR) repeat protein